jgi:thiamine-monophosphate kinase
MSESSFSEFALIARLTKNLPSNDAVSLGVGDDCALLNSDGERLTLATCDSQVEGIHFTLKTSTAEQIGKKALTVNISDVAAMGGVPCFALVSLVIPPHIAPDFVEQVYSGLRQEAERFSTVIIGGNIASSGLSSPFVIDITVLGVVERERVILRSGAREGDILCVTGTLGDAAAGLSTLLHLENDYTFDAREYVRKRHCVPEARVGVGQVLSQFGPQIVTALLDISDGLSGDLAHICERSRVGACVEVVRLPISSSLRTIARESGQDVLHWVLHGGEDYELLFTVAPGYEQQVIAAVQAETGISVTRIGGILPASEQIKLVLPDGQREVLRSQSWDHIKNSSRLARE